MCCQGLHDAESERGAANAATRKTERRPIEAIEPTIKVRTDLVEWCFVLQFTRTLFTLLLELVDVFPLLGTSCGRR
jgi:hypothetical protein